MRVIEFPTDTCACSDLGLLNSPITRVLIVGFYLYLCGLCYHGDGCHDSRLTSEVGDQLAEGRFSRVLTAEQCQGAGLRLHLQLLECSELRLKQQLM